MSRDREVQCTFYAYEGECVKGHEGIFYKTCQKCSDYRPKKNGRPNRKNLKKEKNIKWMNDIRNFE